MTKIRLGSVFSGIGGPEQALAKLGLDYSIAFACDNGERELPMSLTTLNKLTKKLDDKGKNEFIKRQYDATGKKNYVKQSYFANYKISESKWFEDIRFLNGKPYHGKIDLFVGGSPCQSFSIMGKRYGLDDARGTLFYDYARLVSEIEPKAFIYENVPGMLTHDRGHTWKVISSIFESLGYKIWWKVLNADDFSIPQNRRRLFVVGIKDSSIHFEFPKHQELKKEASDFLEKGEIPAKHYLAKKGFDFVTSPKYANRAHVNAKIIRTEKANQEFNWNGDFVFEKVEKVLKATNRSEITDRAYLGEWQGQLGYIRQLTYRECLRLMGFSDSFKIVVPNVPAYRQAGNAIVVDVIAAVIKSLCDSGVFAQ